MIFNPASLPKYKYCSSLSSGSKKLTRKYKSGLRTEYKLIAFSYLRTECNGYYLSSKLNKGDSSFY